MRRTAACRNSLQPRWDADFHLLIRIEDELELLVEARDVVHAAPRHTHVHVHVRMCVCVFMCMCMCMCMHAMCVCVCAGV